MLASAVLAAAAAPPLPPRLGFAGQAQVWRLGYRVTLSPLSLEGRHFDLHFLYLYWLKVLARFHHRMSSPAPRALDTRKTSRPLPRRHIPNKLVAASPRLVLSQ